MPDGGHMAAHLCLPADRLGPRAARAHGDLRRRSLHPPRLRATGRARVRGDGARPVPPHRPGRRVRPRRGGPAAGDGQGSASSTCPGRSPTAGVALDASRGRCPRWPVTRSGRSASASAGRSPTTWPRSPSRPRRSVITARASPTRSARPTRSTARCCFTSAPRTATSRSPTPSGWPRWPPSTPGWECAIQPDGGHAFDNHESEMFSRPEAAARAWELTASFLARTLQLAPSSEEASLWAPRRRFATVPRPTREFCLRSGVIPERARGETPSQFAPANWPPPIWRVFRAARLFIAAPGRAGCDA